MNLCRWLAGCLVVMLTVGGILVSPAAASEPSYYGLISQTPTTSSCPPNAPAGSCVGNGSATPSGNPQANLPPGPNQLGGDANGYPHKVTLAPDVYDYLGYGVLALLVVVGLLILYGYLSERRATRAARRQ